MDGTIFMDFEGGGWGHSDQCVGDGGDIIHVGGTGTSGLSIMVRHAGRVASEGLWWVGYWWWCSFPFMLFTLGVVV